MAATLGMMIAAPIIGNILQWNDQNYTPLLMAAGLAYVLTLLTVHLLAPRLEPAEIESSVAAGRGFAVR